jgi:hypothetical protein
MATHNMLASEAISPVAHINPQSATAGTYTSGWVDMDIWAKVLAVVNVGTISSNGTVAFKLEQATSSGGAGAKDITGKAIVGLTQTPTDNSNSIAEINCRADELDIANSFRFLRINVVTATAASLLSGTVFGLDCKYGPASNNDDTIVSQIIS